MLYLRLFHGRKTLTEDMEDWGEDGPIFEAYEWVHTTYAFHVKIDSPQHEFLDLNIRDDCIYYDGMWYGDWSVMESLSEGYTTITKFDPEKAKLPLTKKKHTPYEIIKQCILRWELGIESRLQGVDELTVEDQNDYYREAYELTQQIEAGWIILEEFRLERIE